MTKGVFVESVLIALAGGVITDEFLIQDVDVEAMLPAAVNYCLTSARNISLQQEQNRDLPSMFFGTFTDLQIDYTTKVPSITLPKGYVSMYGNEGLRSIFDNCNNYYSPLQNADRRNINYYKNIMLDSGFYFPIGKNKVEVYPPNPLVKTLSGEYIVRVQDLNDDDELPLPADTEMMALNLIIQWFINPAKRPADLINNKSNEANVIPRP